MYPGLTNTRVELRKILRSSCFMVLRTHFITARKIQEIAFQGFQISTFSGEHAPEPPRREIVPPPPNFNALAPPLVMNLKRTKSNQRSCFEGI